MRFLTHGDKSNKSILLIHGMANTSDLFDPLLPYLKDYYVTVCELDGHSLKEQGTFVSVEDAAEKIERYVKDNLDGKLYGLLGFSLGGTIATELISRGKKVFLLSQSEMRLFHATSTISRMESGTIRIRSFTGEEKTSLIR